MTDDERKAIIDQARQLKVPNLEAWLYDLPADDPVRPAVQEHLDGRTVTMSIRLSHRDRERLRVLADERGIGPSSLVKAMTEAEIAGAQRRMPPRVQKPASDPADVRAMLGQLGKLGSNVNQIARQMNESATRGKSASPKLERIQSWHSEISAMRSQLLELLR